MAVAAVREVGSRQIEAEKRRRRRKKKKEACEESRWIAERVDDDAP